VLPAGRKVVVSAIAADPLAAIEQASLHAMPAPDPAQLSSRDVIVAVASASVGWVDLLMTSGQYQHAAKPPYTPGLEYAGTIAWAGPDAPIAVGERVLVDPFLAGPRRLAHTSSTAGSRRTRSRRSKPCTGSRARSRSTRRATCSAITRPPITAS
jgi:NADPH2:quinone reductase